MIASAQISVYPLRQDRLGPAIEAVREALADRGLKPEVGPMSTIVVGEDTVIFAALGEAFAQEAETGEVVMTITASNACPRCALTQHRPCRLLARRPVSLARTLMRIGVRPRWETSPKRSSSVSFCAWRARWRAAVCSMSAAEMARWLGVLAERGGECGRLRHRSTDDRARQSPGRIATRCD